MTSLVQAESLKLRSARTSPALALGALVAVGLVALATALTGDVAETPDLDRQAFTAAGISHVFALLLGVLAVTTEFRHGTIVPTLLVAPDRSRLVAAKLAVSVAAGSLLGALAFGLAAAIVLPALAARDAPTVLGAADVVAVVAGGTVGAGLFAALGVGIGALVRNQVGAVIGALGWIYVVEMLLGLVPGLGEAVRRFGLGGLSSGVSGTASPDPELELVAQVPAGLLLAACALGLVVAGTAVLRRRDVAG